jgi:threonine dehydrogenase-like Zn-dependent dehydrogenase
MEANAMVLERLNAPLAMRTFTVPELGPGEVLVKVLVAGAPEALSECISLTRIGGACVAAGFGEPHGKIEIDCFHDIGRKNLRLQGVWVSDVRHTHMSLRLTRSRIDHFKKLITHRFRLSEANKALQVMKAKEAVKAVVLPHS